MTRVGDKVSAVLAMSTRRGTRLEWNFNGVSCNHTFLPAIELRR